MATRRPAVPRTPAPKRPSPAAPAAPAEPAQDAAPAPKAAPRAPRPPGGAKRRTGPKVPLKTPVSVDSAPVPARAFSGRIIALAVVLVAITIMLAPTVRVFLGQRAEISSLQADIAAKHAEQDSLKQSIARWEDPNYVKQQARDRINMVMPGETSYWVFGEDGTPAAASSGTQTPAAGDTPWTQGFWDAFVRAATD
ncbi:septum formation initiator family protein [Sinomonas atrocyanea]|uniref:FtsB family cell division protein n=1 Tax=Sinomonas atrocyanea TaxID=37927 RepID=UPI00277E2959|nr:septum formation initiator family protein [Sinomonas atrocyanea]MDQ0259376.1 cell division protein FtsB [Sinomonas atrocyanea]MDR6621219.1 cell division protein FtsB [Sinomonas atrocyanea]